jgi:hypothetical protein
MYRSRRAMALRESGSKVEHYYLEGSEEADSGEGRQSMTVPSQGRCGTLPQIR